MKGEKIPFQCARCNYKAFRKDQMEYHLNRKRICPSVNGDIELTDEVKNVILTKRIYHEPPKSSSLHTNQTVNYYNHYNNVMNMINTNLTPMQILDTYTKYKQVNLTPIDDYLDTTFSEKQSTLDSDPSCDIELKLDDLLDVINEVSSVQDNIEDLNLFYDSKEDTINIYDDDVWTTSITSKGIKILIEKLQDYYLDYYECYLINKIESCNVKQEQQRLRELASEYYKFLASFDIKSYCHQRKDHKIIRSVFDERQTVISEQYQDLYHKCKTNLKQADKKAIRKSVVDVIKRKTDSIMKTLKQQLSHVFSEDNTFKEFMKDMFLNSQNKTSTIC
jgi:hypothetical protein